MDEISSPPLNPEYGNGTFRRRILFSSVAGTVHAALEDDFHGFRLILSHNGSVVTGIQAETLRIPGSTCSEAPDLLQRFVGRELTGNRVQFRQYEDARMHCTHLHDLLWLASAHALRPLGPRQYDVILPDAVDSSCEAEVRIDGVTTHRWVIDMQSVIAPVEHAGLPLQQGFARWAADAFVGDALEAAVVLQMGIFVGRARRLDVEALRKNFPEGDMRQAAVCYSFQPEARLRYVPTLGAVREFSDQSERLLKFL